MQIFITLGKWLLTGVLILITAAMLIDGSFISAILLFLLTFLVIPLKQSEDFVNKVINRTWLKALICVALFFFAGIFSNPTQANTENMPDPVIVNSDRTDIKPQESEDIEIEKEKPIEVTSAVPDITNDATQEEQVFERSVPVESSAPEDNIVVNNENKSKKTYVLNTNSKKIHNPNCGSVNEMKEENKKIVEAEDISELLSQGYDPCSRCNPN